MLLTIFNLPGQTRYTDIKSLIQSKCGLKDVILDNLTQAGNNTKKVTVGLAEEEDAAILVRKINGMYMEGQQLYVEKIKKKQPVGLTSLMNEPGQSQLPTPQQPYYQQSFQQPSYQLGYTDMSMSYTAGMFGTQNAFANYGNPQQMQFQPTQMMAQSMASFDQGAPLGFNNQGNNSSSWSDQNDWNSSGNASGGNQVPQQSGTQSRWDNSNDGNNRQRHDAPARDKERDGSSRGFGRNAPSRDSGRNAPASNFGQDRQSSDFSRDAPSRDFGREGHSRDFRRDPPSRDFGIDSKPREFGRDAQSRDRGRDAPRDHGRDTSFRDRGRDAPARDHGRGSSARNEPIREQGRDAPFRRNEPNRAPPKRQLALQNTPPTPSYPKLFGNHVTDPSAHTSKFPQQRSEPKRYNPRNDPKPTPVPKKTWKPPGDYNPPPKRQRQNIGFVNQTDNQKANIPAKKFQPQIPGKKANLEIRAATWRAQAASSIAKDIVKNPKLKNDIAPEQFLIELKRALRIRLGLMFGSDLEIRFDDMLKIYREKFDIKTDADFFNEVTEEVKKNGSYPAEDISKAVQAIPAAKAAKKEVGFKKPVVAAAAATGAIKKLPTYPVGDKKTNKALKKEAVLQFQSEDMLPSQLDPKMREALNEEIEEMCVAILEEFKEETPEYKKFEEQLKTTVMNEFKKMMKINFAKRILNIGPIMVRIFNTPKVISKNVLAPVLAEYGVTSLRKSEKNKTMYIGSVETYEEHDRLIAMEPLVVGVSTVTIKPFHLTGKSPRMRKEDIEIVRKTMKDTFINIAEGPIGDQEEIHDVVDDNILELNTSNEGNEGQDNDELQESNENNDVENVEAMGVEPEGNKEGTEENDTQDVESNILSEVTKENGNQVDNTEEAGDEYEEGNLDESLPVENVDTTEGVDLNRESEKDDNDVIFEKDLSEKADLETENTELNPKDLGDSVERDDDIDMAELNDDDLEDW